MQCDREDFAGQDPDTAMMRAVRDHRIFRVSVEVDHDASVICVEGDLDSFTAAELREAFNQTLHRAAVVVDIRLVPFVDSAGLGALVGGVRRFREAGANVALCCTTPAVLRLLAVTGFDRMVAIADTPDRAKEVMAAPQDAGPDS